MSVAIELGSVEVAASASDTRLCLESRILIRGRSHELQETERRQPSTVSLALSDPKAWIRKGHDYRVRLSVAFDTATGSAVDTSLMQTVAERLKASKYWGECGLAVTTVETTGGPPAILVLGLEYLSNITFEYTGRPHRLAVGVPLQDIQPPSGVACYDVAEVHLKVRFSKSLLVAMHLESGAFEHAESHMHSPLNTGSTVTSHICDTAARDLPYPSPPSSQEDAGRLSSPGLSELQLSMLQLALRTAISGPPSRHSADVGISSTSGLRPLASVAPALWSPGHLRNVTSRTVFLPAIGHALANVSRHAVNNLQLRDKVAELARRHTVSPSLTLDTGDATLCQRSLELLTWQRMVSAVRNMDTRKSVSSLLSGIACSSVDDNQTEVILDDDIKHPALDELSLDEDDENEAYDSDEDSSRFDELTLDDDDEWYDHGDLFLLDDNITTNEGYDFQASQDHDIDHRHYSHAMEQLDMFADESVSSRVPFSAERCRGNEDASMLDGW
ncbi:hypothetical protein LTR95_010193 [Oleoguttula sp. CCFEE 5521]